MNKHTFPKPWSHNLQFHVHPQFTVLVELREKAFEETVYISTSCWEKGDLHNEFDVDTSYESLVEALINPDFWLHLAFEMGF